jgi:ankyrin repeat protein
MKYRSLHSNINLTIYINIMELDKDLKKIIKYYLRSKNNDSPDNLETLSKIVILLEKVNNKEINFNNDYLINIKKYTFDRINELINDLLNKNNKVIDPKIFDYIQEGNISTITDTDNIYNFNVFDNNGLSPLHRCIKLGDANILKEFLKKGEKIDIVDANGHTLLEYACLQKDPNMIFFLLEHGANMQKHLCFRKNSKYYLQINDIDTAIICRMCLEYENKKKSIDLSFMLKYIDANEKIGINEIKFGDFLLNLQNITSSLSKETQETLINIWNEELDYNLKNKMGCPTNYLELILINMTPFINYPFKITNRNVLTNELILLIKKISLKNNFVLDDNFKKDLINKIWVDYNTIVSRDYIGVIINHIFSKIKINV